MTEGMAGKLVPRCRATTPLNPQDPPDDWRNMRCIRPDRHRGSHVAALRNGSRVRF